MRVARFRSEVRFENKLKLKKDFIVKTFLQTITKRDGSKQLQVLTQFQDEVISTKMMDAEANDVDDFDQDLFGTEAKMIDPP